MLRAARIPRRATASARAWRRGTRQAPLAPIGRLDAVSGSQPGSRVVSNMSPSVKCSTKILSGSAHSRRSGYQGCGDRCPTRADSPSPVGIHRPEIAPPRRELEVADDHPERVQVQRVDEVRRLQHDVPESLHGRRRPRRTLSDIHPRLRSADVEDLGCELGKLGQFVVDMGHRYNASGLDAATTKPKSGEGFARLRSGLTNSSQARSVTLMIGFRHRPVCSPRWAPCSPCRSASPSTGCPSVMDINNMIVVKIKLAIRQWHT
jgi:hypothetical protein